MDYEKKYNEALKWMLELYPGLHGATKEDAEHYFPELRESNDERIRKYLIEELKAAKSVGELKFIIPQPTREECIAYLEKQKEQKPSPLFKVGDRIKLKSEPKYPFREIIDIKDGAYYFDAAVHLPFKEQDKWEVVQKPELVQQPPITYTYNSNASRDERLKAALLALLNSDLLKVKEGGYFTKQDLIEWVERIPTDKPAEWSEEDENKIESIKGLITMGRFADTNTIRTIWELLDSLRPSWKPSEEQMNALNFAITYMFSTKANPTVLRDLYNDLLKLK